MIRIVEPIDGAILNRNDGRPTASGLEITVRGMVSPGVGKVWVNENEADVANGKFICNIILEKEENRVVAFSKGKEDEPRYRDVITVLWDRYSVPRYRFSVDDNRTFLKDLAVNAGRYSSIFDNDYLHFWREMHEKYGTKTQFNIYYQTEGFNLTEMPRKYRSEWVENADWLRLTFHALQHVPDKPYINATYEEMKRDYLLVTREIERFAGEDLLSNFTTVHWGEAPLEACVALRNCGIKGLVGYFTWQYGGPSPFDRAATGRPCVSYYLDNEKTTYLSKRDYWKDMQTGIVFVRHDIVINDVKLDEIVPHLDEVAKDPHQSEIMELMIHEYCFYPDSQAYQLDFKEKVETTIKWVTNKGYRPVFFDEGFVGT